MTGGGRAALARWAPEQSAAFAEVESVAAASVDDRTLELCRDRVASLLGAGASSLDDWRSSPDVDDRERALLAFVEQFVFSVSSLGDEEVDALLEHESAEHLHEISNVVWALDLGTRLDLVAAAVLG